MLEISVTYLKLYELCLLEDDFELWTTSCLFWSPTTNSTFDISANYSTLLEIGLLDDFELLIESLFKSILSPTTNSTFDISANYFTLLELGLLDDSELSTTSC